MKMNSHFNICVNVAILLATCLLSSCSLEEDTIDETMYSFPAPIVSAKAYENYLDVKTVQVVSEGVGKIYWCPEDEINVFFGSSGKKYISQNTDNAIEATFVSSETVTQSELDSDNIWGLYPYNKEDTLPS